MRIRDFNALNDLLFKYVFGRPERKNITIDFLNAVLDREGAEAIADINFEDRSQDPEYEDGKQSMLDI
ncbi:MAG: PD-(D/E)XK nuclease family transposase, partial [Synergistes sp.]|nr:PD-(D/E)XK nuclease family transposase [Synergistes sp.]